jgi:prophage antirepressor-like protein
VTKEVLPAIRKDGAYIKGEEKVRSGEMSEDEFVLRAMEIMQGKITRLTKEREIIPQLRS